MSIDVIGFLPNTDECNKEKKEILKTANQNPAMVAVWSNLSYFKFK